jgi:hypothetical protein
MINIQLLERNAMSLSPINQSVSPFATAQYSKVSSVSSGAQDSVAGTTGTNISGGADAGGNLASAISQTLSQIGVSAATASSSADSSGSGTSGTSTSQSPAQALAAFTQNLFAALQSQSGTQTAASASSSNTAAGSSGSTAPVQASGHGHHHHHGGGSSNVASSSQNAAQQSEQLSSPSDQSASSSSASGSDSSTAETGDALQQSFSNLLAANGLSGSSATLSGFLQSLSQNIQGASVVGNIVNTVS